MKILPYRPPLTIRNRSVVATSRRADQSRRFQACPTTKFSKAKWWQFLARRASPTAIWPAASRNATTCTPGKKWSDSRSRFSRLSTGWRTKSKVGTEFRFDTACQRECFGPGLWIWGFIKFSLMEPWKFCRNSGNPTRALGVVSLLKCSDCHCGYGSCTVFRVGRPSQPQFLCASTIFWYKKNRLMPIPCFPGDAMTQTVYTLKDESWEKYDPAFTRHRVLYKNQVQQVGFVFFFTWGAILVLWAIWFLTDLVYFIDTQRHTQTLSLELGLTLITIVSHFCAPKTKPVRCPWQSGNVRFFL